MNPRLVVACALAVGLVAGAVGPARGQATSQAPQNGDSAEAEPGEQRGPESYWSLNVVGGALQPLGDMDLTHQYGLVTTARVTWTSVIGVGAEVAASYSPLPRTPVRDVRSEGNYGTLVAGPTYTYGRGVWRLTAVAAGGVAIDRTRRRGAGLDDKTTLALAAVQGGARVEIHLVEAGGLVIGGDYTYTFGDATYSYASYGAGLALTF
jgi:hypothetical protein